MARTGRPKAVLVLTKKSVTPWPAGRAGRPARRAWRFGPRSCWAAPRARPTGGGGRAGCSPATVGKWRSRFVGKRLKGLADEHRSGVPRKVTDDHVEAVIVKTLTEKPHDATHWSTRGWPSRSGCHSRRLAGSGRRSGSNRGRRTPSSCPTDPLFVDKVRDIVALYMNPPERAVVICVDEKTPSRPWTAPSRCCRCYPAPPNGAPMTTYATAPSTCTPRSNLTTGMVTHQLTARHRAVEFKKFLDLIDKTVPAELKVHVVFDNSSTHKTPAIQRWLLDILASSSTSRPPRQVG